MILVTGATGFLGHKVCEILHKLDKPFARSSLSAGVDLRDYKQTIDLFRQHQITKVINCAAYVGGIQFGLQREADLFHNNLLMTINILRASYETKVRRIVNPISNCAYPADARYFKESGFWDGALHNTVMVYGMCRKISWIGSQAYKRQYGLDTINMILSNMYGPGDHFDEERSHALGAIIMKIVKAKLNNEQAVLIWGSGKPIREWLYIDDGAEAMIRGLDLESHDEIINIGLGSGITIIDLANQIKNLVGYTGELKLDESKPDGAPFKMVDGSKGSKLLGWKPAIDLESGLKKTVDWYLQRVEQSSELNLDKSNPTGTPFKIVNRSKDKSSSPKNQLHV